MSRVACGLFVAMLLAVATDARGAAADGRRLFSTVAPRLKAAGGLAVLLPVCLPNDAQATPSRSFTATIEENTRTRYVVDIGFAPDCYGYTACTFGEITGSLQALPVSGTAVRLANGSTAYFTPAECGASCGESTLVWRAGHAYYEVGVRAGLRSTLLEIANSMRKY